MIDLKEKGMPNAIMAHGCTFLLQTDFRLWLTYPERIRDLQRGDFSGYDALFTGDVPVPVDEVIEQLDLFFYQEPAVPRSRSGESQIDYDIDADYIYAAFLQSYGIDLLDVDLHWHKFSALLSALPGETTLMQIIGYRSYDGEDKELLKLKQDWALPLEIGEEEQAAMEEFNELFG